MVGGRKQKDNYYNRATQSKRQPGSAIKPLIYAYAIEKDYTQASLVLDAPVIFGNWRPENYSRTYSGEITLRKALVLSLNIPCVRLLDSLGIEKVFRFCNNMGIETSSNYDLTFSLGSSEVKLINLVSAYMIFPNMGIYIKPRYIRQVKDSSGRMQWGYGTEKRWIMSKFSAAIMIDMLKAVVLEGTAKKARVLDFPVAGKTGTTNDNKDAWFIGFSSEVTAGVWVGTDSNESIGEFETGGKSALPIWIDIMKAVNQKYKNKAFYIPEDMIFVKVDVNTGQKSEKKNAVPMLFRKDSFHLGL
jgi:penicillin-binding protein 1A